MNIKEFCNFLNISEPTIYNWRTDKPNLYKIVMEYKKEKIDNKICNLRASRQESKDKDEEISVDYSFIILISRFLILILLSLVIFVISIHY